MKPSPTRFAFSALASLALMATSANADTIIQFYQQLPALTPIVASSPNATTTTLATTGTGAIGANPPGWVPVFVTILGSGVIQPVFMSFTAPLTSSAAATSAGGVINQGGYTGTIQFNFTPTPAAATNILTVTFNGGLLSGVAGGNSATFSASSPPSTVTFSSAFPVIQAVLAQSAGNNFGLGLSGLTSALGLSGSTVAGFSGSVVGTFSTNPIPEPSSLLMAGIPALMGLGFVGLRRRSLGA